MGSRLHGNDGRLRRTCIVGIASGRLRPARPGVNADDGHRAAHRTRLEPTASDGGLERRQRRRHTPGERPGKRHPSVLGHRESMWFGWSGGTTAGGGGGDVSVSDFGPRRMVALDLPRREASLYYNVFSTARCGRCCTTTRTGLTYEATRTPPTGGSTDGSPRACRPICGPTTPCGSTTSTYSARRRTSRARLARKDRLLPARPVSVRRHLLDPAVGAGAARGPPRLRPVGLQTRSHARNLMHTLIEELRGAQIGDAFVYGSKRCRVGVYPVGTDPDTFRRLGAAPRQARAVAGLRRLFPDQKLVLGVDRLDYTKGVPERLATFERLLERARRSEAKSAWSRSPCPRGSAFRNTRARSGAPTRSSDGSTDGSPGTSGSRSTSSTGRSVSGSWPGSTTRPTSASSRPSGTA